MYIFFVSDDILGKPTTYPPSVHAHTVGDIEDFPVLADVATTGDYNSLINTPEMHDHTNKDVIDLLTDDNGELKYNGKAISTDIDLSTYDAHIADVDIHVTVEDKELWNNKADLTYVDEQLETKVDKVDGKDLSTNDFTDEDKAKLDGLENYELPIATPDVLGGIKIGTGLTIEEDGTISAPEIHEHDNKDVLDKISEIDGTFVYDGKEFITTTMLAESQW